VFATLLGPLPRPPLPGDALAEALLDAALEAQASHGLGPLTDGGWPLRGDDPVASWRASAGRTDALVKAVVTGPYSSGRPVADVRATLQGLADAGCAWIEVHEPAATTIGEDREARARFAEAHGALTADLDGVHLSLAIVGGSADAAGSETILSGRYASLAVDLIEGPDNWRLAATTPQERGIICGVVAGREGSDDAPELLLWAASYAASIGGRGWDRVGLATAGSLAALSWDRAMAKLAALSAGAQLAVASPEERLATLDPRAVGHRRRNTRPR
jgi:Cobalamin-independent synthase, N-terminal domain